MGNSMTLRQRLFDGEAGNVFRGMATLAMGTGMARLIGIFSIPLLTRLYSPEDYGVLAVYTALVTILAPMLTFRYVLAVPLPRNDGMAMNLMTLSALLMIGTSVLLTGLLWFYGPTVLGWMSMEVLAPWWWLVVLGAVATALYEGLSMWATRRRAYRIIAKTQVLQSVLGEGLKLLLGILAFKPLGLLLGQLVSQSGGVSSLLIRFRKDFRTCRPKVKHRRIRLIASYYSGFPLYRLPSQVLLIFATQAPLMLTAVFFDAETTGQLGLALMALALPVSLLGESMGKAYYAEISVIGRKQPITVRKLTHVVIRRLLLLSLLPAAALFIGGEWIFSLAFGSEWAMAGGFASVLAIYLIFQFIQKPVSHLMLVFDGQKELLYLNIQRAILTVLCFWSGHRLDMDAIEVVAVYAIAMSFHYIFSIFIALKKIPNRV